MAERLEQVRCPTCGGQNLLMGICCSCVGREPPEAAQAPESGDRPAVAAGRMDDERRFELACRLRERDSDYLVALLRRHDLDEWQPEVFEIARCLLLERGVNADVALSAAPPHEESGQHSDELKIMATFPTAVDAEPCRSALIAAGFDVYLLDENAVAVDPGLWPALGGVKVAVPSSQAVEALELLQAADRGDLATAPEVAIQCSRCGSHRVRFVTRTDRFDTVATSLLTGVVARSGGGSYICDGCGASTS